MDTQKSLKPNETPTVFNIMGSDYQLVEALGVMPCAECAFSYFRFFGFCEQTCVLLAKRYGIDPQRAIFKQIDAPDKALREPIELWKRKNR